MRLLLLASVSAFALAIATPASAAKQFECGTDRICQDHDIQHNQHVGKAESTPEPPDHECENPNGEHPKDGGKGNKPQ